LRDREGLAERSSLPDNFQYGPFKFASIKGPALNLSAGDQHLPAAQQQRSLSDRAAFIACSF
jgi:hypothetical protein